MTASFTEAIGMLIHHCGALEMLVNNAIKAFATDDILSAKAVRASLEGRISLLRSLLDERSSIDLNRPGFSGGFVT